MSDREAAVLGGLDEHQRACVLHPPGPLAIHAGPGSGKTRVLSARVAYRALAGTGDPRHTLVVTFTRRAAAELRFRLSGFGVTGVHAGTLHAFALQLLERHWADRGRARRVVAPAPHRLVSLAAGGLDVDSLSVAGDIEWATARGVVPDELAGAASAAGRVLCAEPELVAEVYRRYQRVKQARGVLDFADLLREAASALRDPVFADATRWRLRHVLVDEAQDLNMAQWDLVRAVLGDRDDLCLVGDPDQAIYGWNGADPSLLVDFDRTFPGATIAPLGRNYRCTEEISSVASAVLREAFSGLREREHDGETVRLVTAADEHQEAALVARQVRQAVLQGIGLSQLAVLGRTNDVLGPVERALVAEGLPVHRRRDLLRHPAARAALARLEGCGPALQAAGCRTELRAIVRELEDEESDEALGQLVELVDEWVATVPHGRAGQLTAWLASAAREAGGQGARRRPAVELATFHQAKGLEWRRVFVIGLEDGLVPPTLPHDRDEERRLLYVALTRAQEAVSCSWARSRGPLSPFLQEIFRFRQAISPSSQARETQEGKSRLRELRGQLAATRSHARHRSLAVPARSGAVADSLCPWSTAR